MNALCIVKQRNLFSSPLHHPSLCWRAVAMRQMLPDIFFACIWRPKFSNDRFLMVMLQRPHNMWVWKQITEQYLLRKAKCEAPRSLECLSMNNCLTNALQHVHDVILKQRCTTLYSSTPPQSPKHYFDFLYYLLNPSPWQDWESLLSQTVVIAFGFIFCQQLCNDYCCLRLKFMS